MFKFFRDKLGFPAASPSRRRKNRDSVESYASFEDEDSEREEEREKNRNKENDSTTTVRKAETSSTGTILESSCTSRVVLSESTLANNKKQDASKSWLTRNNNTSTSNSITDTTSTGSAQFLVCNNARVAKEINGVYYATNQEVAFLHSVQVKHEVLGNKALRPVESECRLFATACFVALEPVATEPTQCTADLKLMCEEELFSFLNRVCEPRGKKIANGESRRVDTAYSCEKACTLWLKIWHRGQQDYVTIQIQVRWNGLLYEEWLNCNRWEGLAA